MIEIFSLLWAQLGAVGLLVGSGWAMWYLQRKEYIGLQEKYYTLVQQSFELQFEFKSTLEGIVEELTTRKLIDEYLAKIDSASSPD